MPEHDALVGSYVHLGSFPRASEALHTLRKIASLVKPLMRNRNWKVRELAEFYPQQQNLLGLNYNRGWKICIRLRYPGDPNQFMPLEQVVDTMLHELCHNVIGPHNDAFHALWNQLRDEQLDLFMKGYTGESFLSEGQRLGGGGHPPRGTHRAALEAAERRRRMPSAGVTGTPGGQRLGGAAPLPGQDIRRVIANAVQRRNETLKGCATDNLSDGQIRNLAETATRNGFRTQAEEDDANEVAIAQALADLARESEEKHGSELPPSFTTPTTDRKPSSAANSTKTSNQVPGDSAASQVGAWSCPICTLQNPPGYLSCDACGGIRPHTGNTPSPRPVVPGPSRSKTRDSAEIVDLTESPSPKRGGKRRRKEDPAQRQDVDQVKVAPMWECEICGKKMESKWWTCSTCGQMKRSS